MALQYYCHYCSEWQDAEYVKTHFEYAHGQKDVTMKSLQERLSAIGAFDTRESVPEPEEEPKPKNWMWRDEKDPNEMIVTNNFRHKP